MIERRGSARGGRSFVATALSAAAAVLGLTQSAQADEYHLHGATWGYSLAPNGWYNYTDSTYGTWPGPLDDAIAATACDVVIGSPCGDTYLREPDDDPVIAEVRSFDGGGRRLHIASGASLTASMSSNSAGLTLAGGKLSLISSARFDLGLWNRPAQSRTAVEWAGVANPSLLTGPAGAEFFLHSNTDVEGSLEFRGHGSAVNEGVYTQSGQGNSTFYFGFDFHNGSGAVVDLQNDAGLHVAAPDGPMTPGSSAIEFRNAAGATLRKSGGTGSGLDSGLIELPIVSEGTISVSSGQLVLGGGGIYDGGEWSAEAGSTLVLRGAHTVQGSVTTAGAGWMQVGDLDGVGSLTIAGGGTLTNAGKLFQNQTLGVASGGALVNDGNLYNWGMTTIATGGHLVTAGTLDLYGAGARIENGGTLQVDPTGLLRLGEGAVLQNSGLMSVNALYGISGEGGTLQNLAGGSFSGGIYAPTSTRTNVTNAGAFTVPYGNTVAVGDFTNDAGTLVIEGTMENAGGSLHLVGGVLSGTGTIDGDLFVGGGPGSARFSPGYSPGTMTITGNLSLQPGGVLALDVAPGGPGGVAFDQVAVSGTVLLDGPVEVIVGGGVTEDQVLGFNFFDCSSSSNGNCEISYGDHFEWAFPGRPGSTLDARPDGLYITSLAPEPEAGAMMLVSLSSLGWVAHRRTRAGVSL